MLKWQVTLIPEIKFCIGISDYKHILQSYTKVAILVVTRFWESISLQWKINHNGFSINTFSFLNKLKEMHGQKFVQKQFIMILMILLEIGKSYVKYFPYANQVVFYSDK